MVQQQGGARRYRVDLHLHSPAGGDYRGDPETSPALILRRCAQLGLDIAVLADHMTLSAWPEFAAASQAGQSPCVLPGVELKIVHQGLHVHVVAIFDPCGAADAVERLLRDFAPSIANRGVLSLAEIHAPPASVLPFIKSRGGLCVAAHIDRLHNGKKAFALLEEAGGVDAVEFDDLAHASGFSLNGIPRVVSSDAHSLQEIGRRYSELYLDEVGFAGLARALRSGSRCIAGQVIGGAATPSRG